MKVETDSGNLMCEANFLFHLIGVSVFEQIFVKQFWMKTNINGNLAVVFAGLQTKSGVAVVRGETGGLKLPKCITGCQPETNMAATEIHCWIMYFDAIC